MEEILEAVKKGNQVVFVPFSGGAVGLQATHCSDLWLMYLGYKTKLIISLYIRGYEVKEALLFYVSTKLFSIWKKR